MYSSRILLISCSFSSSLMSMGLSSRLFLETYSIFRQDCPLMGLRELLGFYLDLEAWRVGSSYILFAQRFIILC